MKGFSDLGHDVHLLTVGGSQSAACARYATVHTVGLSPFESIHSYEDLRVYAYTAAYIMKCLVALMSMWLRGVRFDLISVHFATEMVAAHIYRFFTRTPIVFVLEGCTNLEARTSLMADARITISESDRELYLSEYGVPSTLCHVGVEVEKFLAIDAAARTAHQTCTILCVSRLEPRKDILTLLMALERIRAAYANFRCSIVGDGILLQHLKRECSERHLADLVTFHGSVSEQELLALYATADVFAHSALYEGFGIVYVEAMASGLPVVSTDTGPACQILGNAGIVTPAADPDALGVAILSLLQDRARRIAMGNAGRERARRFSWAVLMPRYEEVYRRAIGR